MATPERQWAETNNIRGNRLIIKRPGPIFNFWNFDINEDVPRQAHLNFIRGYEFSLFLEYCFENGRKISIVGCTSTSGSQRFNDDLAFRRAIKIKAHIFLQLQRLRRRGDIDQSITDEALLHQLRVYKNPRTDYHFFYNPDTGIRNYVEGADMAANRTVLVEAGFFCQLDRNSVNNIARGFLRANLDLPRDFPLIHMWIPYFRSYRELMPATLDRRRQRSNDHDYPIPRSGWTQTHGYEALQSVGCAWYSLRDVIERYYCNKRDLIQKLKEFIADAQRIGKQIEAEERHIRASISADPGYGTIPPSDHIQRYVIFRDQVVMRKNDSVLRYSGFNPVLLP